MPSEIVFWMEELSESLIAGAKAPQRTDGHERVYDGLEGRYLTRQLPTFQAPVRVVTLSCFWIYKLYASGCSMLRHAPD